VGNPAKQTGWMSEFGHRLNFDVNGFATCPESGEKYILQNGSVSKIKA
jgi:UDP-2-acetamido-3-amino-2,3-dideoxy-glucuronate N-acetyltransferase